MNDELNALIQRALDCGIINQRSDLPWYDKSSGEATDEVSLELWLEDKLGMEKPTLTLNGEALASLISKSTFRLILTREAVRQVVERHLHVVDELIKDRISGEYTPELSRHFHARLESIVHNTVENYLRLQSLEITKHVNAAIDAKLEKTIAGAVEVRLMKIKQRIADAAS